MAFTFFFRDFQTLDTAADSLIAFSAGMSKVKIWNPGCASGQEPYSFLMILSEKMGQFAFKNVRVHTTDIDNSNLFQKIISDGIYPYEQLQRIPPHLFEKCFKKVDETNYQIDYNLRSKITYTKHDLTSLKPIDNDYSLIICKNVLLHLSMSERINVFKMFYDVMHSGALLAMEHTQKLPDEVAHLFKKVTNNNELYCK